VIEIWTDGCCLRNPGGPGAWAVIITRDGHRVSEFAGAEADTTNNRMELMAALAGLGACSEREPTVVSDSRYLVDGATAWMFKWQRNGWRKGKHGHGAPVSNPDLWQRIYAEVIRTGASFRWVRGHNGELLNECCDKIAFRAARALARDG
jgi:ribonuclease HI